MIINSINSLMANNYKKSVKPNKPQFKRSIDSFDSPIEQPTPKGQKFVSDKFSFLKDLFK